MKYIAIEGSSYVGKTTVLSRFASEGYDVIPEYDTFGPFPPQGDTLKECQDAAMNFIYRERQRTAMLGQVASKRFVFSDRSLFSLIAYNDMMMHEAKTQAKYEQHRAVQLFIIDRLEDEIQRGDIVPPDASITLRLDSPEAFEARVQQRGVTVIQSLSRFSVQQLIADKIYNYAAIVLGADASVAIDVSSSTEPEVFNNVSVIATTIQPSGKAKDITRIRKIEHEDSTTATRSTRQ